MLKRNSRSKVILDIDDILILDRVNTVQFYKISDVRDYLSISHKALLVHFERLKNHNLIQFGNLKENYKIKVVGITEEGKQLLIDLKKSPEICKDVDNFNKERGQRIMDKQNRLLKSQINERFK